MSRPQQQKFRLALCLPAVVALSFLATNCGNSSSNAMSAAQAQAVSQQVSGTIAAGVNSAFDPGNSKHVTRPSLSTLAAKLRSDDSSGCTSTDSGFNCDVPITASVACSGGGTMSLTGDAFGTLDNSGDGSLAASLTITPTQCSVDNLVLNGAPDILISSQINFADNQIAFPLTLSAIGGISYGPHPAQTCQVEVTYSVDSTGTCTASGTICGQTISGSC